MSVPAWATWQARPSGGQVTIGIEEEFMLLDPDTWSLAFRSDDVRAALPEDLRGRVTLETHAAVMEIATGVHRRVDDAVCELARLRERVADALAAQGVRAAVAGTHPSAVDSETLLSSGPRYRRIGDSMRVLARREPTLAMRQAARTRSSSSVAGMRRPERGSISRGAVPSRAARKRFSAARRASWPTPRGGGADARADG